MKAVLCAFGSPGFLHPMIHAASALKSAGHEVIVVSGPESRSALRSAGLPRFPRPGGDGSSFTVPDWGNPVSVAMQLKHAGAACDEMRPDVVLSSVLAIGPLLAAEQRGVPAAVLGQLCHLWPADEADLGLLAAADRAERAWRYHSTGQLYATAREACGLPARDWNVASFPLAGDRMLLRSAPELEPAAERLGGAVGYVGSCHWEPPGTDADALAWARSEPGARTVYAYLGRTFGGGALWPWLLDALAGGEHRAFVAAARSDEEPPALPGHVRAAPGCGQAVLLRDCAAVVGSSTTTSALAAVQAGLPMIGADSGGEQKLVTEALSRLGMLRVISRAEPARQLSDVLDDRMMSASAGAARDWLEQVDSRAAIVSETCRLAATPMAGAAR